MKQNWRLPDFLDLEYFFAGDKQLAEDQGETVLRDRDRTLYLNSIGGEDGDVSPDREWLIYRWLQERRNSENHVRGGQALLPGGMWYELYGLFWAICSFLAFASGAGICYSYLSYSGEQPVNVSLFFLVFVGCQVLALFLLPVTWLLRRMRGQDLRSSLLLSLVNKGLNRFLFKIRKTGFDHMGNVRKQQFTASLAAVRTRGKGYGTLFFWPLFLLFQIFGIAFNFGALGALLLKVASADLAFGWQSTIQVSPEIVAQWVGWIALPWSWFLGSSSYPDLAQIEGSRMVLKDGFYHLSSADLVSWWPFLCLSICCYCLLPRIVFFICGSMASKRVLARVSFARAEHNQLVHRLLTPRLHTTIARDVIEVESEKTDVIETEQTETIRKTAVNGELLALVPDELFDDCFQAELAMYCQQKFGYNVMDLLRIHGQNDGHASIFHTLKGGNHLIHSPLLVLQEAWQPPIREMLRFLQELRANCETETHIIVALIGKPKTDTLFTPVSENDLRIWRQKIATLNDPSLQVTVLVEL
jgi:hypothetical protein